MRETASNFEDHITSKTILWN